MKDSDERVGVFLALNEESCYSVMVFIFKV